MKIESEQILTLHDFCFLAGFMLLSIALPMVAINKVYITRSDLIIWGILFLFIARLIRPKGLNTRSDWIRILWQQRNVQCATILNPVQSAMITIARTVGKGHLHQGTIPSNGESFICVSPFKGIFILFFPNTYIPAQHHIVWWKLNNTCRSTLMLILCILGGRFQTERLSLTSSANQWRLWSLQSKKRNRCPSLTIPSRKNTVRWSLM